MNVIVHAIILLMLNILVLAYRLIFELELGYMSFNTMLGIDYYISSGIIAELIIIIIMPSVINAIKRKQIRNIHFNLLNAVLVLTAFSLVWAIIFIWRISDPVGFVKYYLLNYILIESLTIILLIAIIIRIKSSSKYH